MGRGGIKSCCSLQIDGFSGAFTAKLALKAIPIAPLIRSVAIKAAFVQGNFMNGAPSIGSIAIAITFIQENLTFIQENLMSGATLVGFGAIVGALG